MPAGLEVSPFNAEASMTGGMRNPMPGLTVHRGAGSGTVNKEQKTGISRTLRAPEAATKLWARWV